MVALQVSHKTQLEFKSQKKKKDPRFKGLSLEVKTFRAVIFISHIFIYLLFILIQI